MCAINQRQSRGIFVFTDDIVFYAPGTCWLIKMDQVVECSASSRLVRPWADIVVVGDLPDKRQNLPRRLLGSGAGIKKGGTYARHA